MDERARAKAMDEDAAARWAIRCDAGPLTSDEQAALDAWLAADERREGALLRAEAALVYLDRGRALAETGVDEGPSVRTAPHRRAVLGGGLLAVAASVFAFLLVPPGSEAIQTGIGELRRVPLTDGSVATLNTASKISVVMKPERRSIALETGEAWFQVAHDTKRPFVVDAGRVRIRAVGTAFSVRRGPGGVEVLVTEGVVETWIAGRENERVRAVAGTRAFVPETVARIAPVQAPEAVERALAWRNGELALSGEPLSHAVSELNRYNRQKIRIIGSNLRREPVVGYFRTNAPEDFARSIAPLIGARLEIADGELRLIPDGR